MWVKFDDGDKYLINSRKVYHTDQAVIARPLGDSTASASASASASAVSPNGGLFEPQILNNGNATQGGPQGESLAAWDHSPSHTAMNVRAGTGVDEAANHGREPQSAAACMALTRGSVARGGRPRRLSRSVRTVWVVMLGVELPT